MSYLWVYAYDVPYRLHSYSCWPNVPLRRGSYGPYLVVLGAYLRVVGWSWCAAKFGDEGHFRCMPDCRAPGLFDANPADMSKACMSNLAEYSNRMYFSEVHKEPTWRSGVVITYLQLYF